jgi:hypothetical protein
MVLCGFCGLAAAVKKLFKDGGRTEIKDKRGAACADVREVNAPACALTSGAVVALLTASAVAGVPV